jgi:nucleoside-diphosphate-sugar epimerase
MRIAAAIVEDICRPLQISPPIYRRRMDFFDSDSAFDTSLARERLTFHAVVDLDAGLRSTADAYRAEGLL